MRVAIIGAGLSGLAAARTLQQSKHEVVVFEQYPVVGGRVQTTQLGNYIFDPGATTFAPMGRTLEHVILNEVSTIDLVKVAKPVRAHDGVRVVSSGLMAATANRYCYGAGIAEFPKLLAAELDIRTSAQIEDARVDGRGHYTVAVEEFDAVIVTAPVPESAELLSKSGDQRRFSNTNFRSCLSVLLGFDQPFDANYHALVGPDQTHPLSWLSIETLKCPHSRAPEGHTAMVAQMGSEYSRRRFQASDELVIDETLRDVTRLLGRSFDSPTVTAVHRFEHSHPETTASFEAVNSPMSRLVVTGDGLMGGRTEWAYESGIKAAKLLLDNQ